MSGQLGALLYIPIQRFRNLLFGGFARIYQTRNWFIFAGTMTASFVLTTEYLFESSRAHGASMYPTIPDTINNVLVNKLYRNGRGIQVGDVVQIRSPIFQKQKSGKRVIGLPGDYILRSKSMCPTPGGAPLPGITDWRERLERERDATQRGSTEDEEWGEPEMIQVPEGHVWVEGDNLSWSRDSRFFGPVPMALIQGRSSRFSVGWFSHTSLNPGKNLRKVEEDEIAAVLGE